MCTCACAVKLNTHTRSRTQSHHEKQNKTIYRRYISFIDTLTADQPRERFRGSPRCGASCWQCTNRTPRTDGAVCPMPANPTARLPSEAPVSLSWSMVAGGTARSEKEGPPRGAHWLALWPIVGEAAANNHQQRRRHQLQRQRRRRLSL